MRGWLRRLSKALVIAICGVQLVVPLQVAAQMLPFTREDVDRIVEQENFRDPNSDPTCSVGSQGTVVDSTPGPVYFVGDSIGRQIQSGLQSSFSSEGWTFQGSAIDGRTLSGGVNPDGLSQIDVDQEYIKTAKHVIIELGTNLSGMTTENVATMVDKIRALSPQVQIYWVDIAVVNRNSVVDAFNNANAVIYEMASPSQKNYKILSWSKTVFGETIDPTDMGGLADTNSYIDTRDGLNVHLTGSGISAMAGMIAGQIRGGANPGTTTSSGACTCSVALSGDDNKQKIYFFFISKGLTPAQAAGILGNMQAESGFEPRRVEYGFLNSRNEISRPGDPSSLDDNVPPDRNRDGSPSTNGQPGYGIVQFTFPPFKQALRELSASKGVIAGDLSLQLEYLWSVLESDDFRSTVLDPIRAATTSDEASDIFLRRYERPGRIEEQVPIRRANAAAILAELGSLTAPTTGGSGGGCVGGGTGNYPPLVVSGDTTNIPCAAGEDVTPNGGAKGYNDGQLVLINICRVQGINVNSQISKQLDDMMNAATADGIDLSGGAFRTMEDQIATYLRWCANGGITPSPPPYPKPPGETIRCPGGGAPGYSNHQMGLAIDFSCDGSLIPRRATEASNRCFAWLVANARTYGFYEWGALGSGRDDINIARAKSGYEAWHWSVDGN